MAISIYEVDPRAPNLRTVLKLAHALRIDPAELLRGMAAEGHVKAARYNGLIRESLPSVLPYVKSYI